MSQRLALLIVSAVLVIAANASAQYVSDFETLIPSVAGTPLSDPAGIPPGTPCGSLPAASQDCYYIPAGTTSIPWNVHVHGANSLGAGGNPLSLNPNLAGGAVNNIFIAGTGPAGGTFARAQRDFAPLLNPATGVWTVAFDVAIAFTGTLPTSQNIGSFSYQPSGSTRYFIMLMRWTDTNTAANWNADYVKFDAAGVQGTVAVPNPGFQGLSVDHWYRWETDIDMTTNQILQLRVTDNTTGQSFSHCPSDWFLAGGANAPFPLPDPTAFRWFSGGGTAGNTVCIDNPLIVPSNVTAEYQVNHGLSRCT